MFTPKSVTEKSPSKTHNKLFVTSIRYLSRGEKSLERKKNSQLRNNVVNRENLSFPILPSDFGLLSRGCSSSRGNIC